MQISAAEARRVHEESACLVTTGQLSAALDRMAEEITAAIGESAPLVLTVMNGGMIPASELLIRLNFPLETDYLHATRYGDAFEGGELKWIAHPRTDVRGRTVLVIDDIFDQGHTLAAIAETLLKEGAERVLTAVAVNKLHDRKVEFRPDFVGVEVEDRFLYGFGMDYKGYFRNLMAIHAVRGM